MKKFKLSSTILVLVLVAVLFVSCSKNNSSHIPKNAFIVAVIDGKGITNLSNNDFLKDNEEYKQTMESLKQESAKLVELIEKAQKDPDELGLLLTKRSYAFASYDKEELLYGLIIPIDKKKLEANLDLIGTELGFPISAVLSTKDEIKYFADTDMILGWNKEVFIFLGKEGGEVDFELLEKHFNLKKDESILANADFNKFHKNCKDLNLWISSDIIKDIDELAEDIKEFETLTGIDLANNYNHMHLEFKKGEINFTSSLRYNKSIQELDIKKLYENSEALEKFLGKYLDLFNPFNSYDYDEYDYDYDEYSEDINWEDYQSEFTEEEWEEFLKALEEVE
ncbi:MAG TPA: DUF4836 family protein [Bacteroidales bacterium]|nr:DUF4836 family protein [Bacteroidales bacterium]HQB21330.1 DUF4836 family protein [Bacteroidales bacterium]